MVIRLKDTAKLFGITIIACCAVFVCTLFLSYNIDLAAIKDEIVTEAGTEMYNAQVLMGRVIAAVSGGCLIATSVVMLLFYVKNYISTHGKELGILKALGYQEIFITFFDGDVLGLYDHLSEYENLDELNHLACLLSELTSSELETLEAVLDSGDHCSSVRDIINLTQNLDCYGFYPGVSDEETLGRIYVDDLEMLDVPDQVKPYFDYEAYGRDACIHENGHFAPGGYVVKESDHFVEVYHGLQDIPKEHKVFSFPKLSIREQMAAYQEIIDGSSLEGYRQMQKKDRGDR